MNERQRRNLVTPVQQDLSPRASVLPPRKAECHGMLWQKRLRSFRRPGLRCGLVHEMMPGSSTTSKLSRSTRNSSVTVTQVSDRCNHAQFFTSLLMHAHVWAGRNCRARMGEVLAAFKLQESISKIASGVAEDFTPIQRACYSYRSKETVWWRWSMNSFWIDA